MSHTQTAHYTCKVMESCAEATGCACVHIWVWWDLTWLLFSAWLLRLESGKWMWQPVSSITFLMLLPPLPMTCECSVCETSIFRVTRLLCKGKQIDASPLHSELAWPKHSLKQMLWKPWWIRAAPNLSLKLLIKIYELQEWVIVSHYHSGLPFLFSLHTISTLTNANKTM